MFSETHPRLCLMGDTVHTRCRFRKKSLLCRRFIGPKGYLSKIGVHCSEDFFIPKVQYSEIVTLLYRWSDDSSETYILNIRPNV